VIAAVVVGVVCAVDVLAAGVWWGRRDARARLARAERAAETWRAALRHEHLMRVRLAHELEQERADRVECARVDEVAS
jgi:hypothetical protein